MHRSYRLRLFAAVWLLLGLMLAAPRSPAALAQGEAPNGIPLTGDPEGGQTNPTAPDAAGVPNPPEGPGIGGPAPAARVEGASVVITWQTAAAETGQVAYGPAPDALTEIAHDDRGADFAGSDHRVTLPLLPGGVVYYRLGGEDGDAAGAAIYKVIAAAAARLPTLSPAAPSAPGATNRIGIEAGHSASDPGSYSCDGAHKEADNTIAVANLTADILRGYGYTVDIFRGGDQAMRGYVADVFVSLHNDYCAGNNSGFKVSRYGGAAGTGLNGSGDASDRLVNAVWDRYDRATRLPEDRSAGHFTNNMRYYYALSWINAATPGAIIEMAWWSGDRDMLLNQRGILAAGVAESVLTFLGRTDGDDAREIGSGQSHSGTISPNSDRDTYYFSGTQGQVVTITMYRSGGSLPDTYLELYGPRGTMVAENDDSDGLNARILGFTLPQTGRYRIVGRSYGFNSGGGYTLALNPSGGTVSCPDGQYRAQYYNNRTLGNSPVLTRCESAVNYDWGGGSPAGGVGADNFSVRWTGRFNFGGGNWRFIARADDGIRVWVDGALIIDAWRDQGPTEYRAERNLTAGLHEVKIEYYENGGGAVAQVRWESAGLTCTNQYKAEYWNNRTLSGNPVLTRCENWPINWDWGGGSPGGGVPADNFSARWTANVNINAGSYTFIARADDGVRVWLDGALIIDAWRDQGPTEYRVTRTVGSGSHAVRMEYYENGGGAVAQFRWEAASGGGSGNLALNRPANAWSQESSSYAPPRGNDGNNGTRWSSMISSSLGEQRWWADLGSSRTFNRVRINWEAAYAARYRIIFSPDGSTWYCYCDTIYTRGSGGWADHSLPSSTYRYVGVQMLSRAPQMNNYSFWEFEAHGPTRAGTGEGTAAPDDAAPDLGPLQALPEE